MPNTQMTAHSIQVILAIATLIASANAQDKPKLAQVGVYPELVSVEGIWRPDNPTKQNELIEAASSFICSRHGGKDWVGAEAWCLEGSALTPMGMLTADTYWLKVVDWSSSQITATDDSAICITSQTNFDLKSKTVTLLAVRKPGAKGPGAACEIVPDRQTYYLQDKADYYVNKALHSK